MSAVAFAEQQDAETDSVSVGEVVVDSKVRPQFDLAEKAFQRVQ